MGAEPWTPTKDIAKMKCLQAEHRIKITEAQARMETYDILKMTHHSNKCINFI